MDNVQNFNSYLGINKCLILERPQRTICFINSNKDVNDVQEDDGDFHYQETICKRAKYPDI
jgi:hypothetical protein